MIGAADGGLNVIANILSHPGKSGVESTTHGVIDVAFHSAVGITGCVCGDGDPAQTVNLRGNIAL